MKESFQFGVVAAGIGIFLALYFLMGVRAATMRQEGRISGTYLFAPWNLYSRVPADEQRRHTLLIYRIGDHMFEPPVFVERMNQGREVFQGLIDPVHVMETFLAPLAQKIRGGKTAEAEKLQREFERNFLVHPVVYDLVEVTYDPIELWRSGEVKKVEIIASFTSR